MKNEERHIELNDRMVRYLSGEMSLEERHSFEDLLKANQDVKRDFDAVKLIWDGVGENVSMPRYNLDAEWGLLEKKMDESEQWVVGSGQPEVKLLIGRVWMRIAAAVVIGLVGLAGFFVVKDYMSYEQVALEIGTEVLRLPDGSVITLNAGSTVRYAIDAEYGERKVELDGEAFFEIARDTLRPFVIEVGGAQVRVLGTSFNVFENEQEDKVEVTVQSGMVAMNLKRNEDEMLILNPGNKGVYSKKNKELKLLADADPNEIAWKTREISFEDVALIEVLKVLEHVYHVEMGLKDPRIGNCRITVSFSQQELGAVLNVISNTMDLEMERVDGTIVFSGEICD